MFNRRKAEPTRKRSIDLTADQQGVLLPNLSHLAMANLGLPEAEVGNIVIETMCRLTPVTALSEIVVLRTLQEENTAFHADPEAYNRQSWSTQYTIANLGPETDGGHAERSINEIVHALDQCGKPPTSTQEGDTWWVYATGFDGQRLAQMIGIELGELVEIMEHRYRNTGQWRGSRLDLRLTLYAKARALQGTGLSIENVGDSFRKEVDDLLVAIAAS